METFLIKALQLILSLSILVFVHEMGHFLFARLFKVRVEKFYLFFDPWFSLFKFKPKNSDTEYGIGWLPLGGYCKISGMIDESMDKEAMAQPPKDYEYRSKSAGKRLLIIAGGVMFNFILALFIYSMILLKWGDSYVPLKNMSLGMEYSQTFQEIGFQDGDVLLRADNKELDRFDVQTVRNVMNAHTVTVLRNGVATEVLIPEDVFQRMVRNNDTFANIRFPMVVRTIPDNNSPAGIAGIQPNDSIVSINGIVTPTFFDVREQLQANKNREITVGYYRNGIPQSVALTTDTAGLLGVTVKSYSEIFGVVTQKYGFFESFPAGAKLGVRTLKGYVNDMKYVFTKEGASSLGGFGAIGSIFPAYWNWQAFWMQTAFLSIVLAFMNILPIPALDGGHIMFLLYEVIARRKPNDKFMEYAQITGMVLLFSLLIYANGNDLFRFIFK